MENRISILWKYQEQQQAYFCRFFVAVWLFFWADFYGFFSWFDWIFRAYCLSSVSAWRFGCWWHLWGAGHRRRSLSKVSLSSLSALWVIDISAREEEKIPGRVPGFTFWLVGICVNKPIRCWKQKGDYLWVKPDHLWPGAELGCSVLPLKKTQPNHLLYLASIANICFKGIWFVFLFLGGFLGEEGCMRIFVLVFFLGGSYPLSSKPLMSLQNKQ